jgi:transcriptional regulator with XRE-family HTH domain
MQHSSLFGDHLRHYREQAGLTQEQLAEKAGVTAKAIGVLERGERQRPYPTTVQLLTNALKLTEDQRTALLATLKRHRPPHGLVRQQAFHQPCHGS